MTSIVSGNAMASTIDDRTLDKAIRKLSRELDPKKLAKAKKLECPRSSSAAVRSLSGIGICKNLTHLDLSGQAITDLSPLRDLTKLTKLYLQNNRELEELGPLERLTKLEVLYLAGTSVRRLDALVGLGALTTLSLSETPVESLAPLEGLGSLSMVVLRDCPNLALERGGADYEIVAGLLRRGVDIHVEGAPEVDALVKAMERNEEHAIVAAMGEVIDEACF